MAKRPIIIAPDRRLKLRSEPVGEIDDSIRALLTDLLDTMQADNGIGLAAIQIGVAKRCIVADVHDPDRPPLKLVDPEIVWRSDALRLYEEGCLSFPDHYAEVERPAEVRVRYRDETGESCELAASGTLAVCLQHEIDHLDGILFVDHVSLIKRSMILRKLVKARRTQAASA